MFRVEDECIHHAQMHVPHRLTHVNYSSRSRMSSLSMHLNVWNNTTLGRPNKTFSLSTYQPLTYHFNCHYHRTFQSNSTHHATPSVPYHDMIEFTAKGWVSNKDGEAEKWLWKHFHRNKRYIPLERDDNDPDRCPREVSWNEVFKAEDGPREGKEGVDDVTVAEEPSMES